MRRAHCRCTIQRTRAARPWCRRPRRAPNEDRGRGCRRAPRSERGTLALERGCVDAGLSAVPGGSGGLPAGCHEARSRPSVRPEPQPRRGRRLLRSPRPCPGSAPRQRTSGRPGTAAAGPGVEPGAQAARRGPSRVGRRVDVAADGGRANPPSPPSPGTAAPLVLRTCTVRAKPGGCCPSPTPSASSRTSTGPWSAGATSSGSSACRRPGRRR